MGDAAASRLERWIKGDRPAPLELIVGPTLYAEELVSNSTLWITLVVGFGAVGLILAGDGLGLHRPALGALVGVAFILAASIRVAGPRGARLFFPVLAISAGALSGLVIWLAGPRFGVTVALTPAYVAAASLFFTRRTTIIAFGFSTAGLAATMGLAAGYPRPVAEFTFVLGTTLGTVVVIARFVTRLESLARSERVLYAQVEAAKAELEARVTEQVDEIDRLGRLRRFLSPQVADAVMTRGDEEMLTTHRRQIAVIFVDLRGFTGFSAVAEPEDVVEVLSGFYAAVGDIVKRLDATVGGFAGDGVMAYFNDPLPCDDPAGRALDMAISLRDPMATLREEWRDRGFEIGFGVGIAYGYATLGTIGFDQRSDYTPIGSVVNLASRLCDEAADGEVLLDSRSHNAVRNRVEAQATQVSLKGFSGEVTAYRVAI